MNTFFTDWNLSYNYICLFKYGKYLAHRICGIVVSWDIWLDLALKKMIVVLARGWMGWPRRSIPALILMMWFLPDGTKGELDMYRWYPCAFHPRFILLVSVYFLWLGSAFVMLNMCITKALCFPHEAGCKGLVKGTEQIICLHLHFHVCVETLRSFTDCGF